MSAANDNDERWSVRPVKPWGHFKELGFCAFGPIGINGNGTFEYLDCEINTERGAT